MSYVIINNDKCLKCKKCINSCDLRLIKQYSYDQELLFSDPHNTCMKCGHCYAVCPTEAISLDTEGYEKQLANLKTPSFNTLNNLLLMKRSNRQFLQKPVERDKIIKVLDAMKAAPSSGNYQLRKYIVISDQFKLDYLSGEIIKIYKTLRLLGKFSSLLKYFVGKSIRKIITDKGLADYIDNAIKDFNNGIDRIFHNAPHVIIEYSPKVSNLTGNDAGIALTYGMLTAETLGLGSTWIGMLQEAFSMNKKMKLKLNISPEEQVWGVFTLGYPRTKYLRPAPRRDLKVQWI